MFFLSCCILDINYFDSNINLLHFGKFCKMVLSIGRADCGPKNGI